MASTLILVASAVVLVVTGALAVLTLVNPLKGLACIGHHSEQLPQVLAGRYVTFFVLALLAVIHGDPIVLAGLFFAFLVASIADTIIYHRAGKQARNHVTAGVASAGGAVLCLLAAGAS